MLEEAVAVQLLPNPALAWAGLSLALALILSLVAAALFLPVVRGWGGDRGGMLLWGEGSPTHGKVRWVGLRILL